jgi:hypothetical protein
MKRIAIVIAGAAALAACNKPAVNEKNASVSEVANAVRQSGIADDSFLKAGQWQVKATVEDMTMPNLPAEAQAQIKQTMARAAANTFEYCLTEEEARRPAGKFFTGKDDGNCRYDHFQLGGGKFDAAMRCEQQGHVQTMKMNGTYSPDNYTTHVEMNVDGGPQGNVTMKMRSEAKRIGQCTAQTASR